MPSHPLQVMARAYGIEDDGVRKLTVDDIADLREYERSATSSARTSSA